MVGRRIVLSALLLILAVLIEVTILAPLDFPGATPTLVLVVVVIDRDGDRAGRPPPCHGKAGPGGSMRPCVRPRPPVPRAAPMGPLMGYPMGYDDASQIMDEIAQVTPTFAGVSFAHLDEAGSLQWPCNDAAPEGTPIMHVDGFVRGKGNFVQTPYVPTDEKANRKFPLLLTTGRILSQYNVGAQTRRTSNVEWHPEDLLEIHEADAAERGIGDGDWVALNSRVGETHMRARITDRVPQGVVYTTFHHPESGANVVTTENSDWATNCPEYKVTAVQIRPANAVDPLRVSADA